MNDSTATLVVIPTYNEAENIEGVVSRLRAAVPHAHALVVDDGSPDGTGDLAEALAAEDDHVHVLHRTEKAGLGMAYLAGFRWGLERGFDVLCEMDADGSHLPEQLPRLLDAVDCHAGADLVIGSRWIPGGAIANWPKRRELLSKGANTYVRTALGLGVADATAGFRAFRRATLEGIDLDGVESQGYCFQVDLTRRVVDAGFRVVEVPITFVERERGVSKMSGDIVREGFVKVGQWGLAERTRQLRALISRGKG